jgi:hypothetical protein
LAFAVALLALSAPAGAETRTKPLSAKVRVMPPFSQWLFVNPYGDGQVRAVGILGGSIGVEYMELWAVEMGGAILFPSAVAVVTDAFFRGGIAPTLWDGRGGDGRGWTVQLDALAGYRYLARSESHDAHEGAEFTHGLRANLGLDMTARGDSSGLLLRVLSGVTLPLGQRHTGAWRDYSHYFYPEDDLRSAFDIGVDIGSAL